MNADNQELPRPAQPLVIPIELLPGEGLSDALVRSAALNCYYPTMLVLQAAGVSGHAPIGNAGRWAFGLEDALATTLGLSGGSADVRKLLYRSDRQRRGWQEFFGTRMRLVHRSVERRRVSPRALRTSPHLRAIWSIKPFSFDPATKEILLDKCPECGRQFGYSCTVGVAYCEYCLKTDDEGFTRGQVDLRDFPQPLISLNDVEALDFVTGLIDPDPEVRRTFNPPLPECFRSYNRGALFEFTIGLACAITAQPGWSSEFLPRPKFDADYARLTPEVLATAGRAVLNWPAGFDVLADRMRAVAKERPGHFGVVKELGPLVGLTIDGHIEPGLKALAREAIDANMASTSAALATVRRRDNLFREDLITVQQAAARFKVTRKFMARVARDPSVGAQRIGGLRKSPALMSVALLDDLFSKRTELMPPSSAGIALRVPTPALASIAKAGLLTRERDPLCLPPGHYFGRRSVDELVATLTTKLQRGRIPAGAISLVEAAHLLGSPKNNSWASLLTAVLEGRLPAWSKEAVGLSNRIMLASIDDVCEVVQPRFWTPPDKTSALTNLDVMLLLGAGNPSNAVTLVRNGQIPRKPCLRDVQVFAAKYMLTHELGRKLAARQVCTNLRAATCTLISGGVHPVARLTHKTVSLLLWDRAEVEAFLHDHFPIHEASLD